MIPQARLQTLVSKTATGDREALEQLIASQKNTIALKIRRITGNTEDAEDIAQKVAIRICQNIGALKCPEAFGSWLDRLVSRECYRHITEKREVMLFADFDELEEDYFETDADCLPVAYAEQNELRGEVVSALARIPETDREIATMYYWHEMGYKEISDCLGMSVGTVSANLFRIRKRLRKELLRS